MEVKVGKTTKEMAITSNKTLTSFTLMTTIKRRIIRNGEGVIKIITREATIQGIIIIAEINISQGPTTTRLI
jgi:hypothetical protein